MDVRRCLWWLFCIILLMFPTTFAGDGVTVIHRIDYKHQLEDGEFPVKSEIHLRSTSLGKRLIIDDKLKETMPMANSINLQNRERVSFSGDWEAVIMNKTEEEKISLTSTNVLKSYFHLEPCDIGNGGCAAICENSLSLPRCSCPYGYTLNPDNSCSESNGLCDHILGGTAGRFATPSLDFLYNNYVNCIWTIYAPKGKTVQLKISPNEMENLLEILYETEGIYRSQMNISGDSSLQLRNSTKDKVTVKFRYHNYYEYTGAEVFYYFEEPTRFRYMLKDYNGYLYLTTKDFLNEICLSVIYKLPLFGSMEVFTNNTQGEHVKLLETNRNELNGWNISRFVLHEHHEEFGNISIKFHGKDSALYHVAECDNSDDVDVYDLPSNMTTNNLPELDDVQTDPTFRCYNGGFLENNTCVCPVGFEGDKCENACGRNHYGEGCKEVCSWSQNRCKNMIFCDYQRYTQFCTCAPGFKGRNCNDECSPGFYGVNCNLRCGRCITNTCCPYSGVCSGGCIDGFHPPFCLERSLFLTHPPLIENVGFDNATFAINISATTGKGSPYLYQVQYKEESQDWTEEQPEVLPFNISLVNVSALKYGTKYIGRVIIISRDGYSYTGHDVPNVEFTTQCFIPDKKNYRINITNITPTNLTVEWDYIITKNKTCPIIEHEVILRHRWIEVSEIISFRDSFLVTFSNLLPGHHYKILICAHYPHSSNKSRTCTHPRGVTTAGIDVLVEVRDLQADVIDSGKIRVSWKSPYLNNNTTVTFRVYFQCMKQLLCQGLCEDSRGVVETQHLTTELNNLVPLAQYKIKVAIYSTKESPGTEVFISTKSTSPKVSPRAATQPIVHRSNVSATIKWEPPNCFGLNGKLQGYIYQLFNFDAGEKQVSNSEEIRISQVTLTNLEPQTNYFLDVHVLNSYGWNSDHKLRIHFNTSGSVPGPVENLEVYKSGRRMLGIRWSAPKQVYGTLKSFTLSYREETKKSVITKPLPTTHCTAWPDFYCYTMINLQANKNYVISVSAQNLETNDNGKEKEVVGYTHEYAPDAPSYFTIIKSTTNSFYLEWGLPKMFNGELRSFLVNVQHIDSLNIDDCCEYFPVLEVLFKEEKSFYDLKVTDLIPASTYVISVTAKTITLGSSINITHKTAPTLPQNVSAPQVVVGDDGLCIVKIQPIQVQEDIECIYLLLMLTDDANISANISNKALREILTESVNKNFYIISEYQKDEFLVEKEVTIGLGKEDMQGHIGILKNPELTPGVHQVGLAVVLKYGDSINVGFAASNVFNITMNM